MTKVSKIIVGIDPGTVVMGIGVIEAASGAARTLLMDVLKLSSRMDNHKRLQLIYEKVCGIIEKFNPDEFAIEAPFFGKNVQSMLKLGRSQGVAIAAAMHFNIPVTEYSPRKVKQSVTGNGNADKQQVLKMLQHILHFTDVPKHLDATDALAVALCHHFQQSGIRAGGNNGGGWKEFLKNNPSRIR